MKILIVDDEKRIRDVIREYCGVNGYETEEASGGDEALELLLCHSYDLLVLDIMMPGGDGFSLLKSLPKEKRIPCIILSARGDEYDKLVGFDLGVDDYLVKPFSPKELMARIKAVLARSGHSMEVYRYQNMELNFQAHTLKIDGKIVNLTPKEYEILAYFIQNKGIAISREQLLSSIWGYDFFGEDRTVDTHIKMLRNNLGPLRDHIQTVRGVGYKYVEDEE